MPRSILVVGAGIAGLTAALALARTGLPITVIERAAELEEVGAGLQLSPNALRVLETLGLLPDLRKVGVTARSVRLLDGRSGRRLADVPVESEDGVPYLSIHRGALQSVLLKHVRAVPTIDLRLGTRLVSCRRTANGIESEVETRDGRRRLGADLLVAADGVRSQVAELAGFAAAEPSGMTAWRSTMRSDGMAPSEGISAWLAAKRHAVTYPIAGGQRINLVLITPDADRPEVAGGLPRAFSLWNPTLRTMIDRADGFMPWPLMATPGDRPWIAHGGRAVLIGDAAHAMLPYAAQGAGMAIEDASVLAANLIRTPRIETALAAYEKERRPRIEAVRNRVGFHRFTSHLPKPFSFGRNAVLAVTPAARLRDGLGWLYDWTPPPF